MLCLQQPLAQRVVGSCHETGTSDCFFTFLAGKTEGQRVQRLLFRFSGREDRWIAGQREFNRYFIHLH